MLEPRHILTWEPILGSLWICTNACMHCFHFHQNWNSWVNSSLFFQIFSKPSAATTDVSKPPTSSVSRHCTLIVLKRNSKSWTFRAWAGHGNVYHSERCSWGRTLSNRDGWAGILNGERVKARMQASWFKTHIFNPGEWGKKRTVQHEISKTQLKFIRQTTFPSPSLKMVVLWLYTIILAHVPRE